MDALILAGGLPDPEDELYAFTQGQSKALIKMGDRTMLERVVDALQNTSQVEEIVVVGLGHDHGMTFKRPIHHLPDHGSMVGNAIAGLKWLTEHNPTPRHIIGTSSDIPTVTSAIVEDLIQTCTPFDHDLYYTVVTQDVMEKRFPHSKRTYVQFKDLHVAGGDMFIFKTSLVTANPELMEAMSNSRKHAWKLARIVGLRTLIKYLFHRLSLQEVEQAGGRLIDGTVKTVLFPQAELAMDADKADQVKLLQREFQGDTGS